MRYSELLVENKVEFLSTTHNDALLSRYQADTGKEAESSSDIVNLLVLADPTKKTLQWIVNQYLSGQFKIEDISQLATEIKEFHRVKSKLTVKDINQYANLPALYAALKPFSDEEVVSNKQADKNIGKELIANGEADIVYREGNNLVIELASHRASCYFGRGTKWCTASKDNPKYYEQYSENSPLYVIIYNGVKTQLHIDVTRTDHAPSVMEAIWMDEQDQELSAETSQEIRNGMMGFFADFEDEFSNNTTEAFEYASEIIKGRFPAGEEAILQDVKYAYLYASEVIKGRWPEGEPIIMTNAGTAYLYARYVIKGRWPEGEPIIATKANYAYEYATEIIKGRWPEAEENIIKQPLLAAWYATEIIKGRWPEAEDSIRTENAAIKVYVRVPGVD